MAVLWIVVLLAVLALCLLVVGIHVQWADEALRVTLRAGPLRIQAAPRPEKPKKKRNVKKEPGRRKAASEKKKPSLTPREALDAARTLWPPLLRALRRTRRGVWIKPLTVSVVIGGREDPAGAARIYGEMNAALWSAMPLLEKALRIPDPRIHIDVDFDAESWKITCEAGISARMWTLLGVGFGLLIPAVKWYIRFKKAKPQAQSAAKAA